MGRMKKRRKKKKRGRQRQRPENEKIIIETIKVETAAAVILLTGERKKAFLQFSSCRVQQEGQYAFACMYVIIEA